MSILTQLSANHVRGQHYQDEIDVPHIASPLVRLIAYYLPQFHPIPENDLWWGKGFTEWANVVRGLPRFKGHYQPHLPGELGFYDLRLPEVLRRQAQLVRKYGLEGLCFHHYWFQGKSLLDAPIRLLLDHTEIDLPFCINWANENWTRRWDGNDREILIDQTHSPARDLEFAASLEPLFRDPRYIRISGRPLVMVYRPNLLPHAAETIHRWRTHFEKKGLGNPYIVMAQVHGDADPRPYGMDAAAGFPPHNCGFGAPAVQDMLELLDPEYKGIAINYSDMVAAALANRPAEFRLFPGVCPNFDNEARRPGQGFSTTGATPAAYRDWLSAACESALSHTIPDERIVFINAWNEWAEGAHIEPDRHFGYAYLNETARVVGTLSGLPPEELRRGTVRTLSRSRTLRSVPGLILKNLLSKAANACYAFARSLRLLSGRIP